MLLFIYLFVIQIVCTKCLEHLTRAQLFVHHYIICNGLSSYVLGQLLVRQSHRLTLSKRKCLTSLSDSLRGNLTFSKRYQTL